MKLFSDFKGGNKTVNEHCTTADVNPGNSIALGVTNHLTPVNNIVTNVRNLFATMPVVVSVAEDGFSVKINSSQFTSKESVNKILYEPVYQNQSIFSYVCSQGLDKISIVSVGSYFVVYISPSDVNSACPGLEPCACECPESLDYDYDLVDFITEGADDEEEIEVLTKKHIKEILKAKDKVKAAKQLGILVAQQISLPPEYYFAGVKSKDGDESIALRWKYIKRRPHKKSAEVTHSLLNIFDLGDEAVWVGDFDKKTVFQLPEETKKLIESILELIDAQKTSDPCIFKISKEDEKKDDNKDEEDKKSDDNDDSEDNDSRGDDSDNSEDDNKKSDSLI